MRRATSRLYFLIAAFALLAVFAADFAWRANLIARFGSDLPYEDEWNKEIDWTFAPMLEGKPWVQRFLSPHNEHRIYWTLATNTALTVPPRQWDGQTEALFAAALHALILAGILAWMWRSTAGLGRTLGCVAVLVIGLTPLPWENTIWGFQSQFYFLIGFSLLALHGLIAARRWSVSWWIGALAGLAAVVSMGSGFFWTVPVLLVLALRSWLERDPAGQPTKSVILRFVPSIAVALVVLAVGWWLSFLPPWHQELRAKSAADFLRYAVHCLAWPCPERPWLAMVFWAPALTRLVQIVRGARPDAAEWTAWAAVGWTGAQIAALAFARGVGGGFPAPRYGDVLAIGLLANVFFSARLISAVRKPTTPKTDASSHLVPAIASGWLALVCAAILLGGRVVLRRDLPDFKQHVEACTAAVRNYVRSGDAVWLDRGPLPLPFRDWLKETLDRPGGRAILPPSVRAPRPVLGNWKEPSQFGVAPGVPPLPFRRTAGTYRSDRLLTLAEWRSDVLEPGAYRYWALDVAGDLDASGIGVRLVSAKTGDVLVEARSSVPVGVRWKTVYLPVPREPFRLVVMDASPTHWIGWSEPIELSTLTYVTDRFLKDAVRLELLAILALLVAGIAAALLTLEERRAGASERQNHLQAIANRL